MKKFLYVVNMKVDSKLLEELTELFPDLRSLEPKGMVEVCLRKLINANMGAS